MLGISASGGIKLGGCRFTKEDFGDSLNPEPKTRMQSTASMRMLLCSHSSRFKSFSGMLIP